MRRAVSEADWVVEMNVIASVIYFIKSTTPPLAGHPSLSKEGLFHLGVSFFVLS